MKRHRGIVPAFLIAAALVAGSTDIAVADVPNNIFRFGGAWVVPNGDSDFNDGTQDINFESKDGWGYFIDYERRLIPWLGLDFEVLYAQPDFEATAGGVTTTDSVAVWQGNVGVNFHLFARSRFDLYLGAFAGWSDFDTEVDAAFGYGGVLGFDIGLTQSGLALTLGVRYSQTDADVTGVSGASVSYDPLVYQLGLGWRF